jgi:hypothetical protein
LWKLEGERCARVARHRSPYQDWIGSYEPSLSQLPENADRSGGVCRTSHDVSAVPRPVYHAGLAPAGGGRRAPGAEAFGGSTPRAETACPTAASPATADGIVLDSVAAFDRRSVAAEPAGLPSDATSPASGDNRRGAGDGI